MNAYLIIILIIIILLCLYYKTEGWIPWIWNIPTRDIYPPIYYNSRCAPPVYHFYEPVSIELEDQLLVKPRYIKRIKNCPYDF